MKSKKHPKPKKIVKIYPKLHKEPYLDQLAEALLDLVESLPQDKYEKFAKDGKKVLKEIKRKKAA
ncbi:MAG: hypothetical protein WDN66_03700 [Candidatus Saccharibacteria bacterium]